MQPAGGHGYPHEPASPEQRRLIPERSMLVHGAALLAMAVAAVFGILAAAQKAGWFAIVLAPPLALTAFLATWAAVIHLTGGERFDDHDCV